MTHEQIRKRDRYYYTKEHGPIPSGYTIHHLNYSEDYDESNFVVITQEEHSAIHGFKVDVSEGYDIHEYRKKYKEEHRQELCEKQKEYYANHKEERKAYRESIKDKQKEYKRKYNERMRNKNKLIDVGVL